MKHGKKMFGVLCCLLTFMIAFSSCAEPEPDPFAPANFSVEADEDRGVLQLSWDDSMELDIFRAESEAALDTVEKLDIETRLRSYSDEDVVPGTTYFYKGRKMGEETWPFTEVVSLECPQFTPKIREFNVEQDGSKAVITWEIAFWDGGGDTPRLLIEKQDRGDVANRIVYTSYSGNEYLADHTGDGEHTYTTPSGALQEDSRYTFTMKIFPAATFEAYDEAEDTISIAHSYSLVPTAISVTKTGANTISINWTNAADANYYQVYIDYDEVDFQSGQPTSGPVTVQLPEAPESGETLLIWVFGANTDHDHTGRGETTFTW